MSNTINLNTKNQWVNNETPLSAENLNTMLNGIIDNKNELEEVNEELQSATVKFTNISPNHYWVCKADSAQLFSPEYLRAAQATFTATIGTPDDTPIQVILRIDENGVSDRFLKRSCSVLFRCERGSVNVKKRIIKRGNQEFLW